MNKIIDIQAFFDYLELQEDEDDTDKQTDTETSYKQGYNDGFSDGVASVIEKFSLREYLKLRKRVRE